MHGRVHVRRASEGVCSIGDDLGNCKGTGGGVEIAQGSFIDGLWWPVEEKVHTARGGGVGGGVCVTEGGLHVVSGVVDEDWSGGSGGGGEGGGARGRSLVLNPEG